MQIKFSDEFNNIAFRARNEALRTGCIGIGADHLALGLLRHRHNDACLTLEEFGIDLKEFKKFIDARVFQEKALSLIDQERLRPTKAAAALVSVAGYEALKSGSTELLSTHLLLALARSENTASAAYLSSNSLSYEILLEEMKRAGRLKEDTKIQTPPIEEAASALGEQLTNILASVKSKTNFLS